MSYFTKIKLLIICRQIFRDYSNFKKPKPRHQHHVYVYIQSVLEMLHVKAFLLFFSLMSSETDLSRNQAIENERNSFLRGFPLPFNVETLQAFGTLFQIPHYYRKFLHCKSKMLYNYVINTRFCF
jgi:hypothetical protein